MGNGILVADLRLLAFISTSYKPYKTSTAYRGCTTYLKARATDKSGTKVEDHNGGLGAVPPWGPGAKLTTL